MYFEFHKAAILSCKVLLRPIVSLLLRYGVSFNEFCELAKVAYLEAAEDKKDLSPNISQIAVRTGLSRKAVKKLLSVRKKKKENLRTDGLYDLRILEIWRDSPKYQDEFGNPKPLYYSGNHEDTLLKLIGELRADIPPSTIVKRMLSADMLDLDQEGRYVPQVSDPTPSVGSPDTLLRASLFVAAHVNTVANNLDHESGRKLMERQTFSVRVPLDLKPVVLQKFRERCNEALKDIEKILAAYETEEPSDSTEVIGIGMYAFDFNLPLEDLSGSFEGIGGRERKGVVSNSS